MKHRPGERIFGVETEYGTLVRDESSHPEDFVEAIKDHVFYEGKLGLIDLFARDEVFEPAQSGGFLLNGGRLYIDAVGSHLEYATAECRNLHDLIANDRAGQRMVVDAIKQLGVQDSVDVYNNSVDHFHGHTFGCHENYLVAMSEDFFTHRAPLLFAFLVTRQVFAGVGRVGGHILVSGGRPSLQEITENPIDYIWVSHTYHAIPDDSVPFQLSQRADHIIKTIASRVRFNRAIINPKWEHFYAHEGMHRLHILFGESNQSEYAYALKVGTTSLVLRLLEDGLIPESFQLQDPVWELRAISRDQSYKWPVTMMDGSASSALDVQTQYLDLAEQYRGFNSDTDWTLDQWANTLDRLRSDPLSLTDKLDWVNKRTIVETYMKSENLDWSHDALHSIDLEYHNIDPTKSLFAATDMAKFVNPLDIVDAVTDPPPDTRAKGRSHYIRTAMSKKGLAPYQFDWSGATVDRNTYIDMPNPFDTYVK
jgi:proteasome accessory factor A